MINFHIYAFNSSTKLNIFFNFKQTFDDNLTAIMYMLVLLSVLFELKINHFMNFNNYNPGTLQLLPLCK